MNATILAGIPATNNSFYHRLRFQVGDPAALLTIDNHSTLILRDIEMERARRSGCADAIACPADFAPRDGLSGDRETATAQAAAEFLRRAGVQEVRADRTLPLLFAHFIQQAGIQVACDPEMGIVERRSKDEQEISWLREVQGVTEEAMRMACEMVAHAQAQADGTLRVEGGPLTSERLRTAIDIFLLERGYSNPTSIIASGVVGADCHDTGSGPLRTAEPVIIDIFPRNRTTLYWGDCTRTVVHGDIPPAVSAMHAAVVAAKAAATKATRSGVTGEDVHAATTAAMRDAGYAMGLPTQDASVDYCAMTHGTGHGIGLDVHEPPLLDKNGPELLSGDALTIEPGLYCRAIGGVRVEDMVIVTATGCECLNKLPEGLVWK